MDTLFNIPTGIREYNCIICIIALVISIDAKLPFYIHPCLRQTGSNDSCIHDSIQYLVKCMNNDKTPFPPIDPMHIHYSKQEIKNPLTDIELNLTNINIYGLSEFKIIRSRFTNTTKQLDLIFPKVKVAGNLVMDLHVFYFNADGIVGLFTLHATDLEIFGQATSHVKKIKNIDHIVFDDIDIELWISKYKLAVELDGYKHIEIAINTWPMFQNNRLMMDSISPMIIKDAKSTVLRWLREFIEKYPYDDIAPYDDLNML